MDIYRGPWSDWETKRQYYNWGLNVFEPTLCVWTKIKWVWNFGNNILCNISLTIGQPTHLVPNEMSRYYRPYLHIQVDSSAPSDWYAPSYLPDRSTFSIDRLINRAFSFISRYQIILCCTLKHWYALIPYKHYVWIHAMYLLYQVLVLE